MKNRKLTAEKAALMISAAAFLLLLIPAWIPAVFRAAVTVVIMAAFIWQLPVTGEWIRSTWNNPGAAAAALVFASGFGCNFYNTWIDSGNVARISALLHVPAGILLPIAAGILVVAAVPGLAFLISYYTAHAKKELVQCRENTVVSADKPLRLSFPVATGVLFVVFAVGVAAILRANYFYNDDMERIAHGYKQWEMFGRFFSNAMSTFLHMGNYLTDTAPLPQLTAAFIMALSGTCLLCAIYERSSFSAWELIAVVPLGLNPYFLECFSYRYDAPYMAASVLFAVLPHLYRKGNKWAYLLISAIGIVGVCTSYQATTGIYPMIVAVLTLRMILQGKPVRETAGYLLESVCGYAAGLAMFSIVLMKPARAYVSNSLPSLGMLIPNTLGNLVTYYRLIFSDFKPIWLLLIGIIAVCGIVVCVRRSTRGKLHTLLWCVAAIISMIALCFGIYPALEQGLFEPRAMYGFGAMVTLWCIMAAEGDKFNGCNLPVLVLGWVFLVFSFTYGNALDVQKQYSDFRIKQVISDLNDLEAFSSGNEVSVHICGTTGQSPILRNMPHNYNVLNRLVPDSFGDTTEWAEYGFFYYYDLKNAIWDQSEDMESMNLPLLADNMYQSIYGDDSHILVKLK